MWKKLNKERRTKRQKRRNKKVNTQKLIKTPRRGKESLWRMARRSRRGSPDEPSYLASSLHVVSPGRQTLTNSRKHGVSFSEMNQSNSIKRNASLMLSSTSCCCSPLANLANLALPTLPCQPCQHHAVCVLVSQLSNSFISFFSFFPLVLDKLIKSGH